MDDRLFKKLLLPSCVIVALSTALVYELKYVIDLLFFKNKHLLIIGILSAPENFQKRLSLRKTWLQLTSEISSSAYFIIGNEICEVPPFDRADPYTCVDKPFALPEGATAKTEFSTMKFESRYNRHTSSIPSFIGFSFYVRSSIIVQKLGILRELLQLRNKEIQVKLVSSFDNKVLASVTFDRDLLNQTDSPVIIKAIKPVILNTHSEASIKLDRRVIANALIPNCDFAAWQGEPHVINFIQLWDENGIIPEPFVEKSCTFLFMTYTVVDTEFLKQQSNNRTLRMKDWQRYNRKLSSKLENERKLYKDILFVDVIDVYRNLSLKMVHFYKRIMETEYFQYVLKTDDDSFIDLIRVYNQLKTATRELEDLKSVVQDRKFWWWSSFKEFWKVERAGKWREDEYRSASYPMFPCGGGYIINKGIVEYIGGNKHLQHFQGEDVSLGIWLAPLPVPRYKVPKDITQYQYNNLQKRIITKFYGRRHWSVFKMNKTHGDFASNVCEWTCTKKKSSGVPLCNKVQLSISNMYTTWRTYINMGFL